MNKYQVNILVSVILILFGIVILIATPYCIPYSNLHSGMSSNELLSSHFMPKVIVWIMWISSAINIVLNSMNLHDARKKGKDLPKMEVFNKGEGPRVIAFMADFLLYGLLLPYIGFIPTSIICCVLLLLVVREKTWWFYAIDIAFAIAIYFIFKYLLYVQL